MEGLVVQWKGWLHQLINHSYLVAPDLLKCYLAFSFANLFSRLWSHVLACSICEFVFAFLDHVLALQHQRSSDCAIILVSLRPQDPWCCAWKEWFVKERDLDLGLSGGWVVRQNGLICSICGGLGPPFLDLIFPKLALLFFGVTILSSLFISIFGRGELSPDAVGRIFFFGKFDFRHWSFRPLAFHRLASNAAKYWWADASFIYSLGASVNIYFGSWCRVLGEQPCGVCVEIVERDLVFVLDRERGMCMAPELHFGLNAQSKR